MTATCENASSPPPPTPQLAMGPRSREHVAVLDGIRGLAILMVMLYHLYPKGAVNFIDRVLFTTSQEFGATGVLLFFVLSGYLITGILYDARTGPGYFRNFYARRTLRIFPLFYGVLFVLFVLVPLRGFPSNPNYREVYRELYDHQIWFWIYGCNIRESITEHVPPLLGHFWSLAVEEHFYLIWPLAVLLLCRKSIMQLCAIMFVVAYATRAGLMLEGFGPDIAPVRFTFCQLDALGTGAFLAMVARGTEGLSRYLKPAVFAAVSSAIILIVLIFFVPGQIRWSPLVVSAGYTLNSILYGSLLVIAVGSAPGNLIHQLFEMSWLRTLGKYSYALYIFHWPLARLLLLPRVERFNDAHPSLNHYFPTYLVEAIIQIGIVLLVAFASWHLYEKHFLKLKRYFEYRT